MRIKPVKIKPELDWQAIIQAVKRTEDLCQLNSYPIKIDWWIYQYVNLLELRGVNTLLAVFFPSIIYLFINFSIYLFICLVVFVSRLLSVQSGFSENDFIQLCCVSTLIISISMGVHVQLCKYVYVCAYATIS